MNGWGAWGASWLWSLMLVAITITVHAGGIVTILRVLEWLRSRDVDRGRAFLDNVLATVCAIVAIALSLAMLHAIECTIWAAAFVGLHAIGSPADAMLYSVDSMTTRGSSGLSMERTWRMMGAVEAGDGMLLFGISTAFLFAVMRQFWKDDPPPTGSDSLRAKSGLARQSRSRSR
jgi:hypothetical protein